MLCQITFHCGSKMSSDWKNEQRIAELVEDILIKYTKITVADQLSW